MAYDKAVDSAALDAGLTSVADAIRQKGGTSAALSFPQGFVDAIGEISGGGGGIAVPAYNPHVDADGVWHRPTEWPVLDDLPAVPNADYFYLLFDNTSGDAFLSIGCRTVSGQWTIERGNVVNGVFIVADAHTYNSSGNANTYKAADDGWGDYPVFRISATGGINYIYFGNSPTANGSNLAKNWSRMTEAVLHIKTGCDINQFSALWSLERFSWIDGTPVGSINFDACYNLAVIDGLEDWDTSGVTSLSAAFRNCWSMLAFDLHKWDVSNVTSIGNQGGAAGLFCYCYALKEIDISGWKLTQCTQSGNVFQECYSLIKLEMAGAEMPLITNCGRWFFNCRSLKEIDISMLDTSNITSMSEMFSSCYNLERIIGIEDCDVSACTNFGNMFQGCVALERLDLSKWRPTSVTNMGSLPGVAGCKNLKYYNVSGWDTSGMTGGHIFTKPEAATYHNMTGWTIPDDNLNCLPNNAFMVDYYPPTVRVSHSYNGSYNLSHASLMRILNSLPTVTTAQTLTLGTVKARLTAEEIAIATEKGWTVA